MSLKDKAAEQAVKIGMGTAMGAVSKHVVQGRGVPLIATAGSAVGASLASGGSVGAAIGAGTGVVTSAAASGLATAGAGAAVVGAAAVAFAPFALIAGGAFLAYKALKD